MGCCGAKSKPGPRPIETNQVAKQNIRNFYSFGKMLGHGSFGSVKVGYLLSSMAESEDKRKKFAIKTINKMRVKDRLHLIQRELEILVYLDHPNIIRFCETYEDQMYIHFVMEYCEGGELMERVMNEGSFSEHRAAVTMNKLFSAMTYVHLKGIVHRDVKPENILYTSSTVDADIRIIDFGLSRKLSLNELQSTVGTPVYLAPEMISGRYGFECDNWSLGCIMYIMLSGEPPFFAENVETLLEMIQYMEPTFKELEWQSISLEAKQLVQSLLRKNPAVRATSEQALNSEWLKKHLQPFNRKALTLNVNIAERSEPVRSVEPISSNTIKLLKQYGDATKFKKEALRILLNQLKESEIRQLTRKFEDLDRDKNGMITVQELQGVMGQLGFLETQLEIEELISRINLYSPKKCMEGRFSPEQVYIKYSDFMAAILDQKAYLNKERLWSLFKYFDTQNHNYLEVRDLKKTLEREGRVMADTNLEDVFKQIDLNKDGKVDFADFCRMMHQENDDERFLAYFEQNYSSPTKPTLKH